MLESRKRKKELIRERFELGRFLDILNSRCNDILNQSNVKCPRYSAISLGCITGKNNGKVNTNELIILTSNKGKIKLTSRENETLTSYTVRPYSQDNIAVQITKSGITTNRNFGESKNLNTDKSRFAILSWILNDTPVNKMTISRWDLNSKKENGTPTLLGEVNPKSDKNIWGKTLGEGPVLFKKYLYE